MQLELFSPGMAARGRSGGAPAAAAEATRSGRVATNQRLVLRLVRMYPGSTSKTLARLGGMDRHEVARRLPELLALADVFREKNRAGEWCWYVGECGSGNGEGGMGKGEKE